MGGGKEGVKDGRREGEVVLDWEFVDYARRRRRDKSERVRERDTVTVEESGDRGRAGKGVLGYERRGLRAGLSGLGIADGDFIRVSMIVLGCGMMNGRSMVLKHSCNGSFRFVAEGAWHTTPNRGTGVFDTLKAHDM